MSAVEVLHGVHIDEDAIVGKCTNAAGYLEKATQEVERDLSSGITVHWLLYCCKCIDLLFSYQVTSHTALDFYICLF